MKSIYIAGAVAVLVILKRHAKSCACKKAVPSMVNGTDWTGNAWDRLQSLDLFAPGAQKPGSTSNASLGKVGNADAGNYPASMTEILGALR